MLKRLMILLTALLLFLGTAQAGAEGMNILLIGVDSLANDTTGRSDTMILVRAEPDSGRIRMVSFLRDLYVHIPTVGKTRLNAAYYYGGEALLKQTLEENFGVSVDHTVTVHFSLLSDLINQLGGIEIDVTDAERKHLNRLLRDDGLTDMQLERAGLQHLNGQQALAYSRIRKLDSDFQRTSRQQNVLLSMLNRAGELGYWELLKLALANLPKVQTDLQFTDIVNLAPLVTKLDTLNLQLARVPFDGAFSEETIDGMMVLKPNLDRCRRELKTFLD